MMNERTPGLFITGNDTEVGKTYVTALIARELVRAGHRVGVYKPAASGCRMVEGRLVADDALTVWEAAGRPGSLEEVCPQRFLAPLAPHLAAEAEGKRLDEEMLFSGIEIWQKRSDVILVEGAGGLLSPLGRRLYAADLAARFGFPLIVVVPNALGAINQTLLTVCAAENFVSGNGDNAGACYARPNLQNNDGGDRCAPSTLQNRPNLRVAGVVLNSPRETDANSDPSRAGNRRELELDCGPPILAEVGWGADRFDVEVDWFSLAR